MPTLTRTITDSSGRSTVVSKAFAVNQPSVPIPDPVMCTDWSTANPKEPTYFDGLWGGYRVYQESQADDCWNAASVKPAYILLSDDNKYPATNSPATVANGLRAFMNNWNSVVARRATKIRYCWRNEIFNEFDVGAVPQNVFNVFAALRLVADEYDNLEIGIDATTWTITNGDAEVRWEPVKVSIQFLALSLYPPGRVKTPVEFTNFQQFIDPVIAMAVAWEVTKFHIWETGIPIDHANQDTGAPNFQGTTDWEKRPAYMEALLQYVYDKCTAAGIWFELAAYWNRQKTIVQGQDHPPNQFKHDQSRGVLGLAHRWFNWHPDINAF